MVGSVSTAIGLGLVLIWLAALIELGSLPRNDWIGLRLPALCLNDEVWEIGHRAAAPSLMQAGVVAAAAGFAAPFLSNPFDVVMVGLALAIGVGGLLVAVRCALRAVRDAQVARQPVTVRGSGDADSAG